MMFYCFELEKEIKELCTINTPCVLYQYNCLPMGIKVSPGIAQQYIIKILQGLLGKNVVLYIDDCGIWSNGSYKDHIKLVDQVLQQLAENRMKFNPLKCN